MAGTAGDEAGDGKRRSRSGARGGRMGLKAPPILLEGGGVRPPVLLDKKEDLRAEAADGDGFGER